MPKDFPRVGDEFLASLLELEPSRATQMGETAHDHRLPYGGPELVEERVRIYARAVDALDGLDEERLGAEERLDLELLRNEAALERFTLEHGPYLEAGGDPALEVSEAVDGLWSRESRPLVDRLEAITARLEAAPRFLQEARGRYRKPVPYWTREAIRSCGSSRGFLDEVVRRAPDLLEDAGVDGARAEARVSALRRAAGRAQEALDEFGAWLSREVLPRDEGRLALGREAFTELVALRRLDHTVADLEELGQRAWGELHHEYARELEEMYPGRTLLEAEEAWGATAPASFRDVLDAYRAAVADSRRFVLEELGLPLPGEERLDVKETPDFLQKVIPSAAYFEPERRMPDPLLGIYVVTPLHDPGDGTENTPGMIYNTSAHEGYPGHHLQLCWAARNPSPFRAAVSGDEFCEGWAHYSEELMYERGWRPVPGMRAAQLKDAMFRALRIQVDVGLQTGELDVERAVDLLIAEGRIPRERAEGEVAWYSTAPGYPLGYLTGKLLLKELHRRTRAREGEAFDLTRFLTAVLEGGTMPVWAHARRLELLARE